MTKVSDQKIVSLTCALFHTIVIYENGYLWGCGRNSFGQLGFAGEGTNETFTRVIIPDKKLTAVSVTHYHTMAIDIDGYLWGCGYNMDGQLGLGDMVNRPVFTQVSTTNTFQAVSCGNHHTAAIDSEGFLWICGNNYPGQLGLRPNGLKISLTKVSDKKFIAVNCCKDNILVIDEEGYLWGCGDNNYGPMGLDNCGYITEFTKLCDQKIRSVSFSYYHTVAIDIDGYLWSCGDNENLQLCFDSDNTNITRLSKVPNLEQKFLSVSCGIFVNNGYRRHNAFMVWWL